MRTLWTFGCSFTAEWYPVGYEHSPSTYDEYKKFKGGTLPDMWSTILAKKLNYNIKNCGIGGVSNYNILKQFINVIDNINEGDVLIFGWTSLLRFCAVSESEYKIIEMLPKQSYHVNVGFSKTTIDEILVNRSNLLWAEEVQNWIKFINDYCRLKNVEVFHWNSDNLIFDMDSKFINDKNYILPPKEKHFKMCSLINYVSYSLGSHLTIKQETENAVNDLHLGEHGHIKQAEYFYNHIKQYIK
jgi:hypothetical protein